MPSAKGSEFEMRLTAALNDSVQDTTSGLVADGWHRLVSTPEMQARWTQLQGEVAQRYADRLARAGFFRRAFIQWSMWRDFRSEWEAIMGSPDFLLF
jgi:hypothetical protein